jgi:U3 small nucleolar RNA-associated protein 21
MCGNFVLIGYDSGHVDKFNIQSGIHRGSLSHKEQDGAAHPGASIRGICTDGLNQV